MKQLEKLIERIIKRVNLNLRDIPFDVEPYMRDIVPPDQLTKFYAFYGISPNYPIHFHFSRSNLAGSYFLGQCKVDNAVLYKSDIRGDELKEKGDIFHFRGQDISLDDDEVIWIKDSFLIKTLVHNFSHNPEKLDLFLIKNSIAAHYANIHGSPIEGCFLGPFSTVDLTSLHDCVVGTFSYLQVGELSHQQIEPGRIWIRAKDVFDFDYRFSPELLRKYIAFEPGKGAMGMFMDFAEDRKMDFQKLYDVVHLEPPFEMPAGTSVNRYALFKGKNQIGENVLVAQRAFLENAKLGKGANAQENCYISYSRLEGFDITAHGASIIYANLGKKVFVGFNSFLQGKANFPLTVGEESIIMPHTIIDLKEAVAIPPAHLVWGYIRDNNDLRNHSISLEAISRVKDEVSVGAMRFTGSGKDFVEAFRHRIEHILEANGAFFDGKKGKGHAQKGQDISFNIIQPYPQGPIKGIYPTLDINP